MQHTYIPVVVECFLLSFWTSGQVLTAELEYVWQLPSVIGGVQNKQRGLDIGEGVLVENDY